MLIEASSGGLHCVIDTDESGKARLIHFSHLPFNKEAYRAENYHKYYTLTELHCLGSDINDHHGSRYTYTSPGAELRYVKHTLTETTLGTLLTVYLRGEGMCVEVHFQFMRDTGVARCWNTIVNEGTEKRILTYMPSFVYYGVNPGNWVEEERLDIPHNTWHGEMQWRRYILPELGLNKLNRSSLKRLSYMQSGSWSSSEYLPMAVMENISDHSCLFWQIEHNGSWYWECGDVPGGGLYVQVGGPNDEQNHCRITLLPGQSFETVPIAAGVSAGGFDGAIAELTQYRRRIRRPNADNELLPIVFNDYMNCLMGDPSEEKLLPLIEAAGDAGSEYFVIDAGWFTDTLGGDDDWWSSMGEWEPSKRRFPHGLRFITDDIRAHGMIPGIWLELEDIGLLCPILDRFPEDWFFQRHGERIEQHNRYQLDFRNPQVQDYTTHIVEKLIEEYGVGYFKIDYNINSGVGTDYQCSSSGEGLLQHNRAWLQWLDQLFARYPDLIIENCASGGMRMDYAMLSRLSIQSVSDQTDCYQYACIASMASTGVTPEQAAIWSYPHEGQDEEATVLNMVNVMLGRMHLSGFLSRLSDKLLKRVKEGIECYKSIRQDIKAMTPFFPLDLIHIHDNWASAGLMGENKCYVSVWRLEADEDTLSFSLPIPKGQKTSVTCRYPVDLPVEFTYDELCAVFSIKLPQQRCARFFEFTWQDEA